METDDKINQRIAARMVILRKMHGYSIDKVAKACGVQPSVMMSYEHNEVTIPAPLIWKLCLLFNTAIDYFFEA